MARLTRRPPPAEGARSRGRRELLSGMRSRNVQAPPREAAAGEGGGSAGGLGAASVRRVAASVPGAQSALRLLFSSPPAGNHQNSPGAGPREFATTLGATPAHTLMLEGGGWLAGFGELQRAPRSARCAPLIWLGSSAPAAAQLIRTRCSLARSGDDGAQPARAGIAPATAAGLALLRQKGQCHRSGGPGTWRAHAPASPLGHAAPESR